MWVARILQVVGILLAIAAVFTIIHLSFKFSVHEIDMQSRGAGLLLIAYLAALGPMAGLYLLVGTTSTFFLFSEKRRTAYGFRTEPWRSVFWANLAATMAFGGVQLMIVVPFLAFIIKGLG